MVNEHARDFYLDSALQEFDYLRHGFFPGAAEAPAPKNLLPYLEKPIPEVALLPKNTPLFELDEQNMKRVRNLPLSDVVQKILSQIALDKYPQP